jgi:hypothetical protein
MITGNGRVGTEEEMIIASIAMGITVEGMCDMPASMIRASGATVIMEDSRTIEVTIINRKFERSLGMCARPAKMYKKDAVNYAATIKS